MSERWQGRYEPLGVAGEGGQGSVLRARDHQHDRLVALKVRPAGSDVDRNTLLSEARVLLGMRPHQSVPLVRDDFFLEDRYVIVMDWIEGLDLAQVLSDRGDPGLPLDTVISYLEPVAGALAHLHAHRPPIIHGDVKPANLILTPDRGVQLVDFGVSAVAGAGSASGSRGFIAPEVAAGAAPTIASDIYGLAATACTLLTGCPPTEGQPSWEGLDPATVPGLERVIRRGISFEPARRPGSATELLSRLRAAKGAQLPSGVLTFVLTDIESSSALWESDATAMSVALARHESLIADTVEQYGGQLVKSRGEGDSTLSVFERATDAVSASLEIERAIAREAWPGEIDLTVRIGLHTGEVEVRDGDYFGQTVNRAARVRSLANGGEIVLSLATTQVVADSLPPGTELVDRGSHELKGLERPEHISLLRPVDLTPSEKRSRREPLRKPVTQYASSRGVHIAYQVMGEGIPFAFCPPLMQHIDVAWEDPMFVRMFERLASMSRYIMFDKRGTGMSDRNIGVPTPEERIDDFRAVLDAEEIERAVIGGGSDGSPTAILFAATYPERVRGLVLYGGMARMSYADDMPFALTREIIEQFVSLMMTDSGVPDSGLLRVFAPSVAEDEEYCKWFERYMRESASPGTFADLTRWNLDFDVRHLLASIQAPTLIVHRTGDLVLPVEHGRYLAQHIPGAEYVELPGLDHFHHVGDTGSVMDAFEDFLGRLSEAVPVEHVVATVLVADDLSAGDLSRFAGEVSIRRGRLLVPGHVAAFDGAERALVCAMSLRDMATQTQPRIALHAGEVSARGIGGAGVEVARAAAQRANGGDIIVTETTKGLLLGMDVPLHEAGELEAAGLRLWRVNETGQLGPPPGLHAPGR